MVGARADKQGSREPDPLGWHLSDRHELIKRQVETLTLHPNQTADWELVIDLELPTEAESYWPGRERKPGEECLFPFPLVFLKKAEGRMALSVQTEDGTAVKVPIRPECDELSTQAVAGAANRLLQEMPEPTKLDPKDLKALFGRIVTEQPHQASMVLLALREKVGLAKFDEEMATSSEQAEAEGAEGPQSESLMGEIGRAWKQKGLDEVLETLVEHSLIWVLLRGRPGQRRTIVLREKKVLEQRSILGWSFGELKPSHSRWRHPFLTRRAKRARREIHDHELAGKTPRPKGAMVIGRKPYGRRKSRISLSALGERIGQPLAWMPFEFEFPTIYLMRCASYHFEVRCPPAHSPRDLRIADGGGVVRPKQREEKTEKRLPDGTRTTLTSSFARIDVPLSRARERASSDAERRDVDGLKRDAWFRITVGVGNGAFPFLWFLATAVTALMLWLLADANPDLDEGSAQIVAGVLLVVPAITAALALGSNEVPLNQLLGGARILLVVGGLSAAVAATVAAGARPFDMGAQASWSACAMAATAASLPLATSWLLANPHIWDLLMLLDNRLRQRIALGVLVLFSLAVIACLVEFSDDPVSRGFLAACLLLVPVAASVVANNRAAMPVNVSRHYLPVSFLAAGFVCLALACIELRGTVGDPTGLQTSAEWIAIAFLLVSLGAGDLLFLCTRWAAPKPDEVHVSPTTGRAMLAREEVREHSMLRERERALKRTAAEVGKNSQNAAKLL